jgi:hypothetical protein
MSQIHRDHLPVIIDRFRIFESVTLNAGTIFEAFRGYGSYLSMRFTLEQISQGNGREAAWAKRTLQDDDKTRQAMKLRNPRRLITLDEV